MTILEAEGFQQWKDSPLTREFLAVLGQRRSALVEAWGSGKALSPEEQAQAVLLGQLRAMSFEDLRFMAGLEPAEEPIG